MRRFIFRTSVLLAGFLALLVSALNARSVEIELAFGRLVSPLGLALVAAFTVGLLAGFAWQARWIAELLTERGKLRRALKLAEATARSSATAEASNR